MQTKWKIKKNKKWWKQKEGKETSMPFHSQSKTIKICAPLNFVWYSFHRSFPSFLLNFSQFSHLSRIPYRHTRFPVCALNWLSAQCSKHRLIFVSLFAAKAFGILVNILLTLIYLQNRSERRDCEMSAKLLLKLILIYDIVFANPALVALIRIKTCRQCRLNALHVRFKSRLNLIKLINLFFINGKQT